MNQCTATECSFAALGLKNFAELHHTNYGDIKEFAPAALRLDMVDNGVINRESRGRGDVLENKGHA